MRILFLDCTAAVARAFVQHPDWSESVYYTHLISDRDPVDCELPAGSINKHTQPLDCTHVITMAGSYGRNREPFDVIILTDFLARTGWDAVVYWDGLLAASLAATTDATKIVIISALMFDTRQFARGPSDPDLIHVYPTVDAAMEDMSTLLSRPKTYAI